MYFHFIFNITHTYYTYIRDNIRIKSANRRSTELVKNRKKQLREENAAQEMEFEEVEGLLYGPGIADEW